MGIIENAEDGEGKRSASMSEQQRKRTRTHKNRSFRNVAKKQKEKKQKTGGQMKKCGVKNHIFRCKKICSRWRKEMKTYKGSVYA